MHRYRIRIFVILLAALLLAVPTLAQSGADSSVRFVNVIPGAASLDVYVDGLLSVAGLDYGSSSLYIPIASGAHSVAVTQSGVTTTLWQQNVDLQAGTAVTMIASSSNPLGFTAFQEDLNPLPIGSARLTAVHAIAGGPGADVTLADGRAVLPSLQYNIPAGTLDVPAARYDIAVVPQGATIENAIIPVTPLKLNSGTSYMVLAYGTAAQPGVLVLSAAAGADADTPGFVRLTHGIPAAGAVDVYLNDALIAPSLSYGDSTAFVAYASGEGAVSVHAAGTDTVLLSGTLVVTAGQYIDYLVVGSPEAPALQAVTADIAQITPQQALLQVVNTLADGSISVSTASQAGVANVAGGATGSAVLSPEASNWTATVDSLSAPLDVRGPVNGGVLYTVAAVAGDGGPQVLALPPVSIAMNIESAPGDARLAPASAPAEQPAAPTASAAEAQPTAPAPVATTAPAAVAGPTAVVLTDPGVNIHLRQYPSSQAFSLTLVPSGTLLQVVGRPGAPTPPPGVTVTPDPLATPYVDPASALPEGQDDLDPGSTWLFVNFIAPDGGVITGWANASYLTVTDAKGKPQRLADLPTVPQNRAGEVDSGFVAPAPTAAPFEDVIVATIDQLSAGSNLHLRRYPSAAAESLMLIPAGTQLVIEGRIDTGEWYQVTYQGVTGWIASAYVSLTFNDRRFDPAGVPVLATPTPTPSPTPTPGA